MVHSTENTESLPRLQKRYSQGAKVLLPCGGCEQWLFCVPEQIESACSLIKNLLKISDRQQICLVFLFFFPSQHAFLKMFGLVLHLIPQLHSFSHSVFYFAKLIILFPSGGRGGLITSVPFQTNLAFYFSFISKVVLLQSQWRK